MDVKGFIKTLKEVKPKLIILCNPNNPTGTILSKEAILKILAATSAVVIVDEAYIEFGGESMIGKINDYSNLIVLKTLSKAYGLAGVRLGYMIANKKTVEVVNKVRPPYNLSSVTQEIGLKVLGQEDDMVKVINQVVKDRNMLSDQLKQYVQVFPSGGNFIFFKTSLTTLFEELLEKGIRIRKYNGVLAGYFRVTIGTKDQNTAVIKAVEAIYGK